MIATNNIRSVIRDKGDIDEMIFAAEGKEATDEKGAQDMLIDTDSEK